MRYTTFIRVNVAGTYAAEFEAVARAGTHLRVSVPRNMRTGWGRVRADGVSWA